MTIFDLAWDSLKKGYTALCEYGCGVDAGPQRHELNPETGEIECEGCGIGEESNANMHRFRLANEGGY
tara:strand:- start:804 stop:1007 length:204 start_codon:yes stop_codon:yes gene_type:complete